MSKEEMNDNNSILSDAENILWEKWEEKWKQLRKKTGRDEEDDVFLKLYKEIFVKCSSGAEKNKQKNKQFKCAFIVALSIGFGVVFISFIWSFFVEFLNVFNIGVIFLLVIWFASIINKWIEIKKYQETWVRHSDHKFMLEREMLMFLEEVEPYEVHPVQTDEHRAKKFMQNVLDIEKSNQSMFSKNMNEKEKELMDVFEKMGLIKKKDEE